MSDTSLVSRVLYFSGAWLYVLLQTDDTVFGVLFNNDQDNPNPRFGTMSTADRSAGVEHALGIVSWWPEAIARFLGSATGTPVAGTPDAEEAYRRGRNDANAEFEEWKRRATETAHEYADNNDLCSEFDRCMTEIGLEPRGGQTYRVTFDVTVSRGTDAYDILPEVSDYEPGEVEDWTRISVERI